MKNVRMTIWLVAAVLFMVASQGFGVTEFKDGGTHNIDYSEGYMYVDNGAPGMNTTVNLLDGGSIWKWWAYEDSRINISGGSVGLWLVPYGRTQVTMSGGRTLYLYAYDSSKVTMSGGTATGDLVAGGSSQVTLSGGTIAQTLDLYQNAILYLDGTNFAIDGTPFSSGEITSILGGDYGNEPYRTLTGTLANGDIINNQFQIGDYASITLVPEPATLLLLGLGAVMARSKR
jgi:hypothetical protein